MFTVLGYVYEIGAELELVVFEVVVFEVVVFEVAVFEVAVFEVAVFEVSVTVPSSGLPKEYTIKQIIHITIRTAARMATSILQCTHK